MPSHSPEMLREWEWEKHKTRIWHLFLREKRTPEYIRDCMKALGFNATLTEYKSRLKSWGFFRNNPEATRKYISHRVEKRKSQGKRSAVVVAGVRWSDQKIQKETCRNFYKTLEKLRDASPCTPPGPIVSVCSPTPNDLTPYIPGEWSLELPWLRFIKRVSEAPVDIFRTMVQRISRVNSEPGQHDLSTFWGHSTLLQVARHLGLSLPKDISNPIKLSTYFNSTMPEAFQGEHLLRSQNFSKDFDIAAREFLIWTLYRISNNDFFDENECISQSHRLLLDLITQSGLVGSEDPILAEPTVCSILEKVWCAALPRCRSRLVSWILDIGIDPNLPIRGLDLGYHNPLVILILNLRQMGYCCNSRGDSNHPAFNHPALVSSHDIEATIMVLLSHRASPDEQCCRDHGTSLELAIGLDLLDIVKAFVEHGISTQGQNYLRSMDFGRLFCLPRWDTPLERQHAMLDYLQSLSEESVPPPGDPFDILLSTEGLIKAVVNGGPALLTRLRAKGADFNCHNERGEFPMGAVLASNESLYKYERFKKLMELGASVNYEPAGEVDREPRPSALHIASFLGFYDIFMGLLINGANHHTATRFCFDGIWLYDLASSAREDDACHARSPLSWALWRRSYSPADLLLESGAPIEGHELLLLFESLLHPGWRKDAYDDDGHRSAELATALIARGARLDLKTGSGQTALDIAISKGYHEAAKILIRAGAAMDPVTSWDTIEALHTWDWLQHLRTGINWQIEYTRDEHSKLLEDCGQRYPCESVEHQNARLDAMARRWWPRNVSPLGFEPFDFALKCYPQAYSSSALLLLLRGLLGFKQDILVLCLPILHELLKRRRPEFVKNSFEMVALSKLLQQVMRSGFVDLLSVLEVLLSQQPRLTQMFSSTWCNPPTMLSTAYFRWRPCRNPSLYKAILGKLLDSGFRANAATGLIAIKGGCSKTELEQLMACGFNPRKRYRWSHTALQYAVIFGDLDMVRFLLGCRANVNARPRWGDYPYDDDHLFHDFDYLYAGANRTALQFAVEYNNWECAQLLVEYGADVNAPPARIAGATAVQLAAIKGYIGLVKWLISQGADVQAQAAAVNGMTAMEGAAGFGRIDVVRLLLENANFSEGEGRRQYIRAVGYARKSAYRALCSYMEQQIQWSKEDEETLAQEDLLKPLEVVDTYADVPKKLYNKMDNCIGRDCAGETESIDEGMDEPACCRGDTDTESFNSEHGESVSDFQDPSENEGVCSTEDMPNSRGEGVPESYDGGNAPWMSGEHQADTAAVFDHDETFGGFSDTDVFPSMDWEFLSDAEFGNERPFATGLVIGEVAEDEEFTGDPFAPIPLLGWTDPNGLGVWTTEDEFIPGDWAGSLQE